MSAITRYGYRVGRYAPSMGMYALRRSKYGRAMALGKFAWQNRRAIYSAAKTVGAGVKRARRYYSNKRKKRRLMRGVGERPGTSTARKAYLRYDTVSQTLNSRTLYSSDLTTLAATTTDEIQFRQREIANLRGVKFCWEIRNEANLPMYFNFAILSPKREDVVNTTDFFRDYINNRATNFSSTLTSNDFRCRPVNKDKFLIFMHKRYTLAPQNGNLNGIYYTGVGKSFMNLDIWFPIKRQFQYNNGTTEVENRKLFVVYWVDYFGQNSGAIGTSDWSLNRRDVLYWREPKA